MRSFCNSEWNDSDPDILSQHLNNKILWKYIKNTTELTFQYHKTNSITQAIKSTQKIQKYNYVTMQNAYCD